MALAGPLMGARFEVCAWRPQPAYDPTGWRWEQVYYGDNAARAVWAFVWASRRHLPVRVIWR